MDIREKIDQLDKEFQEATNIMFSKKGAVDIKKCQELLSDIKRGLPSSIQESGYIVAEKENILARATEQAEQMKKEAKEYAEHLVEESTIVTESQAIAEKNIKKAEATCSSMIETTKQKIDMMLKNIEDYLMDSLRIIRNNREELAGTILKKKDM